MIFISFAEQISHFKYFILTRGMSQHICLSEEKDFTKFNKCNL